jgi:hypothetical protein
VVRGYEICGKVFYGDNCKTEWEVSTESESVDARCGLPSALCFKVKERIDQNCRGNRRVSISYEFQSWTKSLQEWTKSKRKTFYSLKMRKLSDGPNEIIAEGIFKTSNAKVYTYRHTD